MCNVDYRIANSNSGFPQTNAQPSAKRFMALLRLSMPIPPGDALQLGNPHVQTIQASRQNGRRLPQFIQAVLRSEAGRLGCILVAAWSTERGAGRRLGLDQARCQTQLHGCTPALQSAGQHAPSRQTHVASPLQRGRRSGTGSGIFSRVPGGATAGAAACLRERAAATHNLLLAQHLRVYS